MKKNILLILCSFFLSLSLFSQVITNPGSGSQEDAKGDFSLPQIVRPSPTVAQLMKMEEASLTHYTGQPNINISLYEKSLYGLKYSIGLQYHVSGIRNTEQSGWVGTGWALNNGGVIARSVNGLPDDLNSVNNQGVHHSGYENLNTALQEYKEEFWYDAQYSHKNMDFQRDIYQFNFFGRTGRFVVIKKDKLEAKIIRDDQKLKINIHYDLNNSGPSPTQIDSFTVIDERGYRFLFKDIETTDQNDTTVKLYKNGEGTPVPSSLSSITYRSAWKLSYVNDPNNNRIVTFDYKDVLEEPEYLPNYKEVLLKIPSVNDIVGDYDESCVDERLKALRPSTTFFKDRTINSKKIKQVVFADSTVIDYSSDKSHPEYTGAKLNNIEVKKGVEGIFSKKFVFSYLGLSDLLFLNQVSTYGASENNYTFTYKNPQNLPPFGANYLNLSDDFGYYKSNINYLDNIDTGALIEIEYPTGGERKFKWESNQYSYKSGELIPVEEILQNPINNNYYPFHSGVLNFYNDSSQNQSGYDFFYVPQNLEADLSYIVNGDNSCYQQLTLYLTPVQSDNNPIKDNSRSEAFYDLQSSYQTTISLEQGYYKIHSLTNSLANADPCSINVYLELKGRNLKENIKWYANGGGLRIKSIIDNDSGLNKRKKVFDYGLQNYPAEHPDDCPFVDPFGNHTYTESHTIDYSSGAIDGLTNRVREYDIAERPIGYKINVEYHVIESLADVDAQLTQGNYIGYKNVAEYEINTLNPSYVIQPHGEPFKGYAMTRYTFDTSIDYPMYFSSYGYPYPALSDKTYKWGNITKKETYDKSGQLLKKVDIEYNYHHNSSIENYSVKIHGPSPENYCRYAYYFDMSYYSLKQYLAGNSNFEPKIQYICGDGLHDVYSVNLCKGPGVMPSVTEKRLSVQKTRQVSTDYFYDDGGNNQGEVTKTVDYTYGSNLKVKEKTVSYEEGGGTIESKVEYIYPYNSGASYATTLINQNRVNELLGVKTYKNGNLLSYKRNIYAPFSGYYLLSEVHSGKYNSPSLTSTQIEDKLEPRLIYEKYDEYGNPLQVKKADGSSVTYVWGYHHSLPVAKIENATYAEVEAILGTGFDLGGQGLGSVQETNLRTGLSDALVTVYEYDPLIGIIRQSDPRGYQSFYEYDEQNRLEYIKDDNGDVIKSFDYNYRNPITPFN